MRSYCLYLVSLQCPLKSVCPLCCKRHTFLFSKSPCVTAFWPSNCHLGASNCLPPLYKRSSQLGVDSVHPHIEGQQGVRPLPENPATLSHLAPLCVAWGRQWVYRGLGSLELWLYLCNWGVALCLVNSSRYSQLGKKCPSPLEVASHPRL